MTSQKGVDANKYITGVQYTSKSMSTLDTADNKDCEDYRRRFLASSTGLQGFLTRAIQSQLESKKHKGHGRKVQKPIQNMEISEGRCQMSWIGQQKFRMQQGCNGRSRARAGSK